MAWTYERIEETDDGGNVHSVIVVSLDDGGQLRFSPNYTDEELAAAVERELTQ